MHLPEAAISPTTILLTTLGGVALILFGVQMIREGIMHALGPSLRLLIEKSTRNRFQALGAGILVTSLIQSATATVLIVTSFASRRLIPVAPALAVSLGADIGTTLVAQVLSIGGLHWLGPVCVLVGMTLTGWFARSQLKQAGTAFIGLGLILVGLTTIGETAHVIEESPTVHMIMEGLAADMFMAFLIGTIITWITQSSLAVVLLVMSFAVSGSMNLDTAFALVIGTHLGSAITPLLVNLKEKNEARQVAWGSFLMRLVSCLVFLPLVHWCVEHADYIGGTDERIVVNFHTFISVVRSLAFLPFVSWVASGLVKAFPVEIDRDDPSSARYLDERDLAMPSVALASASREALRLGDMVLSMMREVKGSFHTHRADDSYRLNVLDNHVDRLYEKIKFYLARLSREAMTEDQAKRHVDLLMFITNLEHIGDIIVRNLCELSDKKWRNNLSFSKQGWEEIEHYHTLVCDNFELALNVFATNDPVLARELVRQKEVIQREGRTTTNSHFDRLRQGLLESMRSSSLHLDIIRDLRRINDHLTTVAYSILEKQGVLQSRLRDEVPSTPSE